MTFKKGTTFTDAVEVKPLDTEVGPRFRIEADVIASAAVTALEDPFFIAVRVVTTAGTTVAGKIPIFTQ